MFSSLTTKLALKKLGLPTDTKDLNLNITNPFASPEPSQSSSAYSRKPNKLTKNAPLSGDAGDAGLKSAPWPAWMSVKSLPLTVQPWLTPTPPPIPVAEPPRIGDLAPLDRDRKLTFGGGKMVLVVFLRCVGCAFAQKTFLKLRALANRYSTTLTCIAVSHSSEAATRKWLDLIGGSGGAGSVQIVIDEDRAIYAAWGLGLGSVWYVFNPTSQVAGFKQKGWLGATVAGSLQKSGSAGAGAGAAGAAAAGAAAGAPPLTRRPTDVGGSGGEADDNTPATVMGNKWQQAGAWAVNGRGKIVWGGKALRADDVMELDQGVQALGLI
ncbi:hypothetical protein B0T17DRAFT_588441 [Bombardia bombarda]|uniref:Alkyl hydroperoxide reductase subunit C/ Thiol specific antioxidant domain-containing protein n=1 Tax=Bombardia bombarda TaxID=252184 RepID=A0AA40C7C7_9PEZI|nr:hypothetical protein B0T17DRAFT_588441 [Bombardia bombarda]